MTVKGYLIIAAILAVIGLAIGMYFYGEHVQSAEDNVAAKQKVIDAQAAQIADLKKNEQLLAVATAKIKEVQDARQIALNALADTRRLNAAVNNQLLNVLSEYGATSGPTAPASLSVCEARLKTAGEVIERLERDGERSAADADQIYADRTACEAYADAVVREYAPPKGTQ